MYCTEIQAFVFPPARPPVIPQTGDTRRQESVRRLRVNTAQGGDDLNYLCHKENLFSTFQPLNSHLPGPATLSNQDGNFRSDK